MTDEPTEIQAEDSVLISVPIEAAFKFVSDPQGMACRDHALRGALGYTRRARSWVGEPVRDQNRREGAPY